MVASRQGRVNLHAEEGAQACLHVLASQPLYGAIARHYVALSGDALPDVGRLNDALVQAVVPPRNATGRRIRFVQPDASELAYEVRIHEHGEVATRPYNWHDFFNALVWMSFPQTKAALNALHVRHGDHPGTGRGPIRDAATQFDESGIVVLSSDAGLLDLLARRCWKELFWDHRAAVVAHMRFLVFGHGLYDALRAPFYRMCGRAALIEVPEDIVMSDVAGQCEHADAVLAQRFADGGWYPRPRVLMALPLLGIPGVTQESECQEYYEDREQFQPPPS